MSNSIQQQIRAISFDLDDTLWDNRPVLIAAEQVVFDWLASNYPRIGEVYDWEALHLMRHALAEERPDLQHDMTRLRKESLSQLATLTGYDESLVEPAFEVFIEARHRVTLFDDVIPALENLRERGFLLGALTNGNASIKRLGIDHLFDFSVSAEEAGAAKPDPRMFEIACKRSGVSSREMVHVGDEPATDIEGARRAGIRAIWMNRTGVNWQHTAQPDAEVKDMSELLELIDSMPQ
ncbi:MAG: HAD family hydrolase [Candidatus Sedimenticola sp. 20ELBAFRAG]